MSEQLPKDQIAKALEDIEMLCNYAYIRGFHEMGYNPVETVRRFKELATEELDAAEKEIGAPSRALQFLRREIT